MDEDVLATVVRLNESIALANVEAAREDQDAVKERPWNNYPR
jgi:hypothetical protein